jgi:hypothetical protein
MAIGRTDYTADVVAAARSVLLELTHLLGQYRDDIVVVGGWVPELLLPQSQAPHIGSTDVDLALNHRTLQEAGYRTIKELLLARGYREGSQPFIFHRSVQQGGREIVVEIDFLAGEYEGTGQSHRTQKVQGVRARKARGCDLAFDDPTEVTLHGVLPEGGEDTARVRVASIVPFLTMKGIALAERLKEKDAWDVVFCLQHYPSGVDALIQEFRPHLAHSLVQEGLKSLAEKFSSPNHVGPKFVADFEELTDPEARALVQRDAYERVQYLLQGLGIP